MLRKREMEEQMRRQREEGYRMGNFMDGVSLAPWSPGVVTLGGKTLRFWFSLMDCSEF